MHLVRIFNPRTPCGVRPTVTLVSGYLMTADISIHAPLAGCDGNEALDPAGYIRNISIHAPLAGCDYCAIAETCPKREIAFQSTHPLRGATRRADARLHGAQVSDFNPRTPCGVRLVYGCRQRSPYEREFQSTHPLRGATMVSRPQLILPPSDFNPRTPCGVRRAPRWPYCARTGDFNPRTPCGVRPATCRWTPRPRAMRFQSTHPLRGATLRPIAPSAAFANRNFNPRTPCGVTTRP